MDLIFELDELRGRVAAWRSERERIAFVPTMGNLHAAHIALVRRARRGELNLGHTLLGRRKAVFGQRDTRASKKRISLRSSLQ